MATEKYWQKTGGQRGEKPGQLPPSQPAWVVSRAEAVAPVQQLLLHGPSCHRTASTRQLLGSRSTIYSLRSSSSRGVAAMSCLCYSLGGFTIFYLDFQLFYSQYMQSPPLEIPEWFLFSHWILNIT